MWRKFQRPLFNKVKRAIREFDLIEDGDSIAVGVSGGKDSVILLYTLATLRKITPISFDIKAITLDLGWGNDFTPLHNFCTSLDIPYYIKETEIGKIVYYDRQEKSPCSLCAKMRRGALHNYAKELGCNKVALGHHLDDAIETFLLSLTYEGRINTFSPKSYLSRIDLTLIRPLIFVYEEDIFSIVNKLKMPVVINHCPADGRTKRQEMKELILEMETNNPVVRDRILSAINNHIWTGKLNN